MRGTWLMALTAADALALFQQHSDEANEIFKVGRAKHDPAIPGPQAAAAMALAQALLNHDACVVKR